MTPLRWLALAALCGCLAWAGWGMIAGHARVAPEQRLAEARDHLQHGRPAEAAAIAREVLAEDPSHGSAFAVLAQALADPNEAAATLAHYETAARRAPRDVHVRAWLAAHHLQAGDYPAAVPHLDALLTVSPESREQALPLVVQLAADRGFADALATHLAEHPRWRALLLRTAQRSGVPDAADNLHAALRERGALAPAESARWIDGMLAGGRWGTAYAYWIGDLERAPEALPLLFNGGFERPISNRGFDWRLRRTNGVVAGRVEAPGGGHALRLTFLGRNVGRTGLEQPLLLAPGRYRLELRARTRDLRSHRGLEWQLTCSDNRTRIGSGATITTHPGWADLGMEFEVPARDCEGQWLRLVNPAPRGAAQALRGELHLTALAITPARTQTP